MERIVVNPQIHFGKPIIKGTRITVQNVLELINDGLSFDQIRIIIFDDLIKRQPIIDQFKDILYCDACPFDDWFTEMDLRLTTTRSISYLLD